ncbi:flavin reductase family protein [Marinigracilibium pacificum]|uniref:Flavin reductase family protein n=1 Tax=Marinigracilibium pacificum TaxID=2729599 RepID=A0A848J224_9BACT|nr:flavin reductase family protein [Marinigracilibium pacificum]NMM48590.1 flavin reductase family protein [Marinigracilibium pacificum]
MNPEEYLTIKPGDISVPKFHHYLLGAVAPRPIAFASTVDKEGNVNLSPFSFFNVFGANPPIMIFSPARRGRDNTTKHTFENVKEVKEVVINIVNYSIVEQMSLASTEYDKGVNEFVKSGLTPVASEIVTPPRVGESPVAFECKVNEVVETGTEGGAGNLIICEVLKMHIKKSVLDENDSIDIKKIDLVARMGGNWYCRANGDALFEIAKPLTTKGIGVDAMPGHVKNSSILTGNDLGKLGNVESLPDQSAIDDFGVNDPEIVSLKNQHGDQPDEYRKFLHLLAQKYLNSNEVEEAWLTLLQKND